MKPTRMNTADALRTELWYKISPRFQVALQVVCTSGAGQNSTTRMEVGGGLGEMGDGD